MESDPIDELVGRLAALLLVAVVLLSPQAAARQRADQAITSLSRVIDAR